MVREHNCVIDIDGSVFDCMALISGLYHFYLPYVIGGLIGLKIHKMFRVRSDPGSPTASFRNTPASVTDISGSSVIGADCIIFYFFCEFAMMSMVLKNCSEVALIEERSPLFCALTDYFDIILYKKFENTDPGLLLVQEGYNGL